MQENGYCLSLRAYGKNYWSWRVKCTDVGLDAISLQGSLPCNAVLTALAVRVARATCMSYAALAA